MATPTQHHKINKLFFNKYFLFDFVIMMVIAAAGFMAPSSLTNVVVPQDVSLWWLSTMPIPINAPSSWFKATKASPLDEVYPVGTIVEYYNHQSEDSNSNITAVDIFPAVVTGVAYGVNGQYRYHIRHGITHEKMVNVDPKHVYEYEIYSKGTDALCNVGPTKTLGHTWEKEGNTYHKRDRTRPKTVMVPCKVISHEEDDYEEDTDDEEVGDDVIYQVKEGDDTLFLNRLNVKRLNRGVIDNNKQSITSVVKDMWMLASKTLSKVFMNMR